MATIPESAATPTGTVDSPIIEMEDHIEGAPEVYWGGDYAQAPDLDGHYWGLTGSVPNPVYHLGCFEDLVFSEDVTISDVICDTSGVEATVAKRNYLTLSFTLKSIFPFSALVQILKGGDLHRQIDVGTEGFGLGEIDNSPSAEFLCYFSLVYDITTNDFFSVTGHKCRFMDAFSMPFTYGEPVTVNVTIRMHADRTKPVDQRFATFKRLDPSEIP